MIDVVDEATESHAAGLVASSTTNLLESISSLLRSFPMSFEMTSSITHPSLLRQAIVAAVMLATFSTNLSADHQFVPQNEISLPDGGSEILAFGPDEPMEFKTKEVVANGEWISVEDQPLKAMYSIQSDTRFTDPIKMRVRIPVSGSASQGDAVLISFWMRRPGAGGQPNNAYFFVDAEHRINVYQYKLFGLPGMDPARSFIHGDQDFDSRCLRSNPIGRSGYEGAKSPTCDWSTMDPTTISPRCPNQRSCTQAARKMRRGERRQSLASRRFARVISTSPLSMPMATRSRC